MKNLTREKMISVLFDIYKEEYVRAANAEMEVVVNLGSGWLSEYIRDIVSDGIYDSVYSKYSNQSPNGVKYNRRYKNGGLADPNNIVCEWNPARSAIKVENIATGNSEFSPTDSNIEPIILSGHGYHYKKARLSSGRFDVKRDYYAAAQKKYDGQMVSDRVSEEMKALSDMIVQRTIDRFKQYIG